MNTTEDKMKKPPTPSGRGAARIAALERECAGWLEAADRVRCERDDLVTLLADIEALLPPPTGDDDGLASRVRRVVEERDRFRTRADARDSLLAEIDAAVPGPGGTPQRVRAFAANYDYFRKLTDDAHKLLADARIPYGPLPKRVAAIIARCETIAATSAPSERPVTDYDRERNRATLAPLLDLLEIQVGASRGSLLVLAAVRAVVGVARG